MSAPPETEDTAIVRKRVAALEALLDTANAAIEDLNVQSRFWRQAAEHAVVGWDKLEGEHELLLDTLRALVKEHAVDLPAEHAPVLQSVPGFTIVETEKPLDGWNEPDHWAHRTTGAGLPLPDDEDK